MAVITVIDVELQQVLKAFDIPKKRGEQRGTNYYWITNVYSRELERPVKVVIGCMAEAGMVHAAIRTASFLQEFRPTMVVLVGIAAGWRVKQRIGQVVWPRHVTAIGAVEVHENNYAFRPVTHKLTPAVAQMLKWWKVNDTELASLTDRILAGEVVNGRDLTDDRGLQVVFPPKAEECVIGCGDFLLRHDSHFLKMRTNDPQVTICEMESGGMVLALRDVAPNTAWLQVRGVSDFGDTQKHSGWHVYAAAGASAFVRLFAEQCYDSSMITGVKRAAPQPTVTPEASTTTRSVATLIPVDDVESGGAGATILQDFEAIRTTWKKARDKNTLERLKALRATLAFRSATPETRAKILRFEVKVSLDMTHDLEAAVALAKEASDLAGKHRATDALIVAHRSGPTAAAEMLANPTTLEEWNQRMGFFLQAQEPQKVLAEWTMPPEGVGPDVESHRLHTYALLMNKQVPEARVAFQKVGAQHRDTFAIRLVGAVLDYYEAVSPAAPARAFQLKPLPIPVGFVKRDEVAMAALERAEICFSELVKDVSEKNEFHYELQGWRLGAAAMNARRRSEAEELCRQLVDERPTDVQFLGWAEACGFRVQRDDKITAMASELGVKL